MDALTIARLTGVTRIEISAEDIALRLFTAFILGVVIALTYRKTHKAFAFSYSMVVAIVVISVIVSMVLMVIDNSLARAFGLVGALAIIRFRTPVKDVRDIVFLFLAVANGIACGAGAMKIAFAGVLSANLIAFVLYSTRFGGPARFNDLLVKIGFDPQQFAEHGVSFEGILEKYCSSFSLIELQSAAGMPHEIIYSIRLADERSIQPLVAELSSTAGVNNAVVLSSIHNMDMQ